jgi:hypothetical protein
MNFDFSIEFDSESVHPDFEDVSTLLFYRAMLRLKYGVAYHRAKKEHKDAFRKEYYPKYIREMITKFGLLPNQLEDYHAKWYIKYYMK